MALGGALGLAWAPVTQRHFAWQAWHKLTPTVVLRGRRGTNSHPPRHFAWQAWHKLTPTVVSVAGVAQTHTYCRFTWQAWHKLTSTVVLCGRRGTNSHPPSFCVAGVALMALGGALGLAWAPVTPRHFAWQAWHNLTASIVFRHVLWSRSSCRSCCSVLFALAQLEVADIAEDSVTTTTTTMTSRQ